MIVFASRDFVFKKSNFFDKLFDRENTFAECSFITCSSLSLFLRRRGLEISFGIYFFRKYIIILKNDNNKQVFLMYICLKQKEKKGILLQLIVHHDKLITKLIYYLLVGVLYK